MANILFHLLISIECYWTEYGEFGVLVGKKFDNFTDIRKEILVQTEQIAGNGKDVSVTPIKLRIYSPNVFNITLVDLPGISNAPYSVETENTEKIILKYIRKENCLILAISTANTSLASSNAVKLARMVDENGTRTINVITKFDLMDAGTDAQNIFNEESFPLPRGYVGVVNRLLVGVNKWKSTAAMTNDERYRDIYRLGSPYLPKVLYQHCIEHICKITPFWQDELRKQLLKLNKEIDNFKYAYPNDPALMR